MNNPQQEGENDPVKYKEGEVEKEEKEGEIEKEGEEEKEGEVEKDDSDSEEDSDSDIEEDNDSDTEEKDDSDTEEDSDSDTKEKDDSDTKEDNDSDTKEKDDGDTKEKDNEEKNEKNDIQVKIDSYLLKENMFLQKHKEQFRSVWNKIKLIDEKTEKLEKERTKFYIEKQNLKNLKDLYLTNDTLIFLSDDESVITQKLKLYSKTLTLSPESKEITLDEITTLELHNCYEKSLIKKMEGLNMIKLYGVYDKEVQLRDFGSNISNVWVDSTFIVNPSRFFKGSKVGTVMLKVFNKIDKDEEYDEDVQIENLVIFKIGNINYDCWKKYGKNVWVIDRNVFKNPVFKVTK